MANVYLTNSAITNRALAVLKNTMVMGRLVNRQYSKMFGNLAAQNGATISIRKPPRYIVQSGNAINMQNSIETYTQVTLTQKNVGLSVQAADLTLDINDFSRQFIEPAVAQIANTIDQSLCNLAQQVSNATGTPGTNITSLSPFFNAGEILDNWACPRSERYAVISPAANASLGNSLTSNFNPQVRISEIYEKGIIAKQTAGFDFYMDQNVYTHTYGTYSGTPVLSANISNGATSVTTSGWTAGSTLNAGDIVQFAGVNSVNPMSRANNRKAMQVVVSANATADGSGNMTINFSPALIGPDGSNPDQFQNVTALPVNGAAVTVFGASGVVSKENIVFNRDAFTLAFADLDSLWALENSRVVAADSGVSIRMTRGADIQNDVNITRLDVLYGVALLRYEYACRVSG